MFNNKKSQAASRMAAAPSAPRSNGSTFSVFGADLVIRGNVEATVDLHIDGRVEGDITCASIVQGEGSSIVGHISADTARLGGAVDGSITAIDLVVEGTAQITGDIFYETIVIEQGGQVDGKFVHRAAEAMGRQNAGQDDYEAEPKGGSARVLDLASIPEANDDESLITAAEH